MLACEIEIGQKDDYGKSGDEVGMKGCSLARLKLVDRIDFSDRDDQVGMKGCSLARLKPLYERCFPILIAKSE